MLRDRVSFAMIVVIPLLQLLLFGYAINTTPRNLPTAVLLQETSDVGRSILAGARTHTAYFKITHRLTSVEEFDRVLASGKVLFAIEIPAGFERALRRGDKPVLLVAADATDPVASGTALGSLSRIVQFALVNERMLPDQSEPLFEIRSHPRYNPAASVAAEHRARPRRHHPDHDHADLHRTFGDARARARHHGEPAFHADHAARNHDRENLPLHHCRLHPGVADHRLRRASVRRADPTAA